ncbi:hypothetical protein ACFLSQ_08635, partial [Bacteroidota bacterium]
KNYSFYNRFEIVDLHFIFPSLSLPWNKFVTLSPEPDEGSKCEPDEGCSLNLDMLPHKKR